MLRLRSLKVCNAREAVIFQNEGMLDVALRESSTFRVD